jgi:ketosteroid isomerase-like protein
MNRTEAASYAAKWAENWNRVDIDAVADRFAEDSEMRSPHAIKIVGDATVHGREAIRAYWHSLYGHVTNPNLTLEDIAFDEFSQRLIVWWRADLPSGAVRASELMQFNAAGEITRSEAYYGAA